MKIFTFLIFVNFNKVKQFTLRDTTTKSIISMTNILIIDMYCLYF